MVFGWTKKKNVKESVESTRIEKQISISEINTILKENEMQRLEKLLAEAKIIKTQLETERKSIINIISQLKEDNLKIDEVDKRIKGNIERGKDTVISGIRRETAVKLSEPDRYSNVVNLNSEVAQMLKRMGDILGVNTRIMHAFARKYTDKLKEVIAKIATNKRQLQEIINEHTNFESNMSNVFELLQRINDSRKQIEMKNHNLAEIDKKIIENKKALESLKQEIMHLKSKNEYENFLIINKEINSLKPELDKIKHEMDIQFSKISRPLGKYSYISSLEKPLKIIMERMIENPFDALTQENKNSIITILHAVVKAVVSGNVSVKDSQKAIEQIEETINRLDEFLLLKENLVKKKNDLENKLSVFNYKILEEKEKETIKVNENQLQLESTVKIIKNDIGVVTNTIPQLAHDIESKLSEISGIRLTLRLENN